MASYVADLVIWFSLLECSNYEFIHPKVKLQKDLSLHAHYVRSKMTGQNSETVESGERGNWKDTHRGSAPVTSPAALSLSTTFFGRIVRPLILTEHNLRLTMILDHHFLDHQCNI